jgi:hypothetical protein
MRSLTIILLAACALASPILGQDDWTLDERTSATINLPQKAMTLEEICTEFGKQTSSEFYADRRDKDVRIGVYVGQTTLGTAMSVVESATGLEWRMVGNMFFLSRDARGVAVTRWEERYAQVKEAHLAGIRETEAREWFGSMMPFPPRVDAPWQLTPLQEEQFAYQGSLPVFTMTPPQIGWLNTVLPARDYRTAGGRVPVEQLAMDSPELTLELSAAMLIRSGIGDLLVEMPLSRAADKETREPASSTPQKVELQPSEADKGQPKKTNLKEHVTGLWVTRGNLRSVPDLLTRARARGVNHLFLPVLEAGHTVYPSKRLPQDSPYKGSDVLKDTIKAADALGIKVHAVLNATLWGDAAHPVPKDADYPLAYDRNLLGRTYAEQEKWQRIDLTSMQTYAPPATPALLSAPGPSERQVCLCPASSLTPRLVRSVAEELGESYGIAGICLDGVDYPESTPFVLAGEEMSPPFGYTLEVRREMIRLHQVDPIDVDASAVRTAGDAEAFALWDKFRRGRLTGLIAEVCSGFREKRPDGICTVTLDLTSDGPSPAHWSKIAGLDALIPFVEIRKPPGDDAFAYSREEADVAGALHRAVLKDAAVIPAVTGLESDLLAEEIPALAGAVKLAEDTGLKGYIIRGDTRTLESALDVLGP